MTSCLLAGSRRSCHEPPTIDGVRRLTFAYVMNKMAPGMVRPIAWALFERTYDLVNR